ncbi:hypothetical protein H4Q26_013965 [Puccinia striiformis f. sp. tritici PST-130]|nr:hypothetical protein H4Q26_013965 [Puccinia striiformis f. sp. tritici PST-130]
MPQTAKADDLAPVTVAAPLGKPHGGAIRVRQIRSEQNGHPILNASSRITYDHIPGVRFFCGWSDSAGTFHPIFCPGLNLGIPKERDNGYCGLKNYDPGFGGYYIICNPKCSKQIYRPLT